MCGVPRCDADKGPLRTAPALVGGVGAPALLPPRLLGDERIPLPTVFRDLSSLDPFCLYGTRTEN
jgi:hypothetical protein